MSRNGEMVAAFERELAAYCDARFCVALANGTATLHTALMALGVEHGAKVAVPPLTHAATTMAVLQAGCVPVFTDIDPLTWIMPPVDATHIGVSLYGLHGYSGWTIDDAAQTLKEHDPHVPFTSLSFQNSKLLSTGEGGALLTNDEALATRARSFSSLGYDLDPRAPRIDVAKLKSPDAVRHVRMGWNYRMNDVTAARGLQQLAHADTLKAERKRCAVLYCDAIAGCSWVTPQHVPDGWTHDYWCFAIACDTPEQARALQDAVVRHGGERPYAAWRLTYHEPVFTHLAASCPVAESLQPRLLQFQTNDVTQASANAFALREAILELNG